ncbi:MAG: Peptide deformylase [Phycisphaerae bacterium]|nr:Peptide deformylase [Phycisphaerae bacterium]
MKPLSQLDPAKLSLVRYPHPVLRAKTRTVEDFGEALDRVARRMLDLMRANKGVGLAAPQVGLSLRLFVCNDTGNASDDLVCVNPSLTDPDGEVEADEGCLSIPGVTVPMRRAAGITLHAQDALGRPFERRADDLLSRIFQHEYDHLVGRLILDGMSEAVRIENRRAIRTLEDEYQRSAEARLRSAKPTARR